MNRRKSIEINHEQLDWAEPADLMPWICIVVGALVIWGLV